MIDKTYTFHSDPGHGWLEVERQELVELGIADKISSYSYQRGDFVYLEEDCDYAAFYEAYKAKFGHVPRYVECFKENTPIRQYRRYHV